MARHPDQHDDVFIVVPAYNESNAIGAVLSDLRDAYANVVVVDDGSSDDTHEVARAHGCWSLLHFVNRGQGAALQTGIEFALRRGARIIVTFDADGQHQVEDIEAMVDPIRRGECDVTLGSRFLGGTTGLPASRALMLRAAVRFTRVTSGLRVTDAHNGFRALSREAASRLDLRMDRMAHASEILDQIGRLKLPYREVPVHIRYTEYSMRKGQRLDGAMRILVHYMIGRVFG